jgi:hypothetical protein
MRRTVESAAVFALAACLVLVGCSVESPTTPINGTSFFREAPAAGFDVLRRNSQLATDVSETRVIGPEGGRIDIAGAGISFVVPPGALTEARSITMTAVAGDAMAVEFAPHGLRFDAPATLHMRTRGTRAESKLRGTPNGARLDSFLGVYFDGRPERGVDPLENIAARLLDGAIVFEVSHFSGYACASG